MVLIDVSRNPIHTDFNLFTSKYYAFSATGGFSMKRAFDTIQMLPSSSVVNYDVTYAVQMMFDVSIFNTKLGLVKDSANQGIVSTSFNNTTELFPNDSITLSIGDFRSGLTTSSQIVSVGKYATLYSDFQAYVLQYFGWSGGFASLFSGASTFAITDGQVGSGNTNLSSAGLYNLMKTNSSDLSGGYILDMSGSITISNVNSLLRYAVDSNVFNNRSPTGINPNTGVYDPTLTTSGQTGSVSAMYDFGVGDGFMANDLVYIPAGSTIQLNVKIGTENLLPINNVGATFAAALGASQQNVYQTSVDLLFTETTTASTSLITRTLTAPILLRLVNFNTTAPASTNKWPGV